MQRIESNGLLFGVEADSEYPVCGVPLEPSDRLLLYTDGVTETENAAGEAFGDRQLERVVRDIDCSPPPSCRVKCCPSSRGGDLPAVNQQDDITLIVVDVL